MRRLPAWPLFVALAFFVGATWLVISGDARFPHFLNQNLDHPVFARVDFERVNQARTDELRKRDQQLAPDYYRLNRGLVDRIRGEIQDLHAAVKAVDTHEQFQQSATNRWPIDQEAFEKLKGLTDESGSRRFKRDVDHAIEELIDRNMIERFETDRVIPSRADFVEIDRGQEAFEPVKKIDINYVTNSRHVSELASAMVKAGGFATEIRPALSAIIEKAVVPGEEANHYQPVYVYDREYTRSQIEAAGQRSPETDAYRIGDPVAQAGTIDADTLALLRVEHGEYLRQRDTVPELLAKWRQQKLGLAAAVLLLTCGLIVFTLSVQPRIVQNVVRAAALAGFLLGMLIVERIMLATGNSPMWSVGAVTITAAVLTIAYSQRFAIGATALFALLSVIAMGESIELLVLLLTVATVNVLLLAEIRTRLKLFEIGALTTLAAGLCALAMQSLAGQTLPTALYDAALAAIAAFAGTSILYVLLPVIERAFGIATSLTLLEWADTSNPLLRQLIQKAPGTWQHSHLLGSMAEAAAETIGANGLLVRVGAYYHDIGKVCKPAYFVENQHADINAHDGLAPTMSLLVILAHVKDGLALAREHALPPVLHQFIAEHHGTTVVRYFHAMAAQEAKPTGKHDREVSEAEFRYPGPKPRTREAVILMLCDSVEGAIRALHDPTPGRIESKVHEIFMARLLDGQVDDCEITLKELAHVERSLVKSLCAIHHGRIAYPAADAGKPAIQVARTA